LGFLTTPWRGSRPCAFKCGRSGLTCLVKMLMDICFSEIGRQSHQHLNNLRRQLGTGVDPAYDYSAMHEMQKKLANAGKQSVKQKSDRLHGEGGAEPTSGLDLLKRTLKEVVGVGAGLEDVDSEQAEASHVLRRSQSSPADISKQREASRNTSAFKAPTRDSLKKMDVENRFRAPPIGSYRPKDAMLTSHERQPCHEFAGVREVTRGLLTVARDKEIERLQEEGQDATHLIKPWFTSVELKEGIPEKPKARFADYQMAKDIPRPAMASGHYNDNSFTAGVLDGKDRTSDYPRLPAWDFAKTSTSPEKPREYYFQPGQYPAKWEQSKPTGDRKNIGFEKQPSRKALLQTTCKASIHLPDRSLARPSAIENNCTPLQRRVRDVHIAKCTTRKPPYEYVPPMYDDSDPRIEEAVLKGYNAFDAFEAMKVTKTRLKPAEEFGKSLTRLQHHKTMRAYGVDICYALAKTALTQGPVSTEFMTPEQIHEQPSLQRKVLSQDHKKKVGREPTRDCIALPPRGKVKEMSGVMSFGRGTRAGDARAETGNMSKLAGAITELRGSRTYDALPRADHPRPSVDCR